MKISVECDEYCKPIKVPRNLSAEDLVHHATTELSQTCDFVVVCGESRTLVKRTGDTFEIKDGAKFRLGYQKRVIIIYSQFILCFSIHVINNSTVLTLLFSVCVLSVTA